jgi:hypothetical protein
MSASEVPTYCTTNAGAKSSRSDYSYYTFGTTGIASATFGVAPTTTWDTVTEATTTTATTTVTTTEATTTTSTIKVGATLQEGKTFTLKNVNSGLYMEVEGGTQANGTNVQQWGMNSPSYYNTWTVKSAGNGYYYIYSSLGDGNTYLLDLDRGLTTNGANISIYENTNSDAQLFKFVANSDGSYKIVTKATQDASCVEIKDASTTSGANVQQWAINGVNCQDWILDYVDIVEETSATTVATTVTTTTAEPTTTTKVTTTTAEPIATTTVTTTTAEPTTTTKVTTTTAEPIATTKVTTTTAEPTTTTVIGDIDGSGEATALDVLILKRYVLAIDTEIDTSKADLNQDGEINVVDLLLLKKIVLNIG